MVHVLQRIRAVGKLKGKLYCSNTTTLLGLMSIRSLHRYSANNGVVVDNKIAEKGTMLKEETQLGLALEAFSWAHSLGEGWAPKHLKYFTNAGITSISDLEVGCKEDTVNLDLELFGVPPEEQLSSATIQYLRSFLPGHVGLRCFRVAQKAAQKVKKGTADTDYVHRPESGKIGNETWSLPVNDNWTLHVDCAGFVRNALKHVTKNPFVMSLSDRDFMRAKDFFGFFSAVPYTVMDKEEITESDKQMRWRRVPDLRMVIPGDIIVYRPRGNAAGGAAFTKNDRKDLTHLLKAVKTAQLWQAEGGGHEWKNAVTRNVAKDPQVRPWVNAVKAKLQGVGIYKVKDLKLSLDYLNMLLTKSNYSPLCQDTIRLMKECVDTPAENTGHIVFAAGTARHMGDNDYRVRVVHSTKYGKRDENGEVTTGVQEYYKRFQMVQDRNGKVTWTRGKKRAPAGIEEARGNSDEEEDNPKDDMEEDEPEEGEEDQETPDEGVTEVSEELSGCAQVDVLVMRMCF